MANKTITKLLTSWWARFYAHFINQPQAIIDLYTDHVDDLNNALQCNNCFSICIPEDVICPDCHQSGHFEVVWVPGIEEDELASRYPVGPITPEEYVWLLENRERMKSQQAWNVALAKHGHEGCNASNCEFCVEIEHNRLMREGEI